MKQLLKIFKAGYLSFNSLSGEVKLYPERIVIEKEGLDIKRENIIRLSWKAPSSLFHGYLGLLCLTPYGEIDEVYIQFGLEHQTKIKDLQDLLDIKLKVVVAEEKPRELPSDIL